MYIWKSLNIYVLLVNVYTKTINNKRHYVYLDIVKINLTNTIHELITLILRLSSYLFYIFKIIYKIKYNNKHEVYQM